MPRRLLTIAAITLVSGYAAICVLLYTQQRRLLFPAPASRKPAVRVIPASGTVVVYFHGNGMAAGELEWLAQFMAPHGFVAIEYPGYGALPGSPSEESIYEASQKQLESLGIARERIVLFGQSIGTGAAVEMAKRGWGRRLVLVTPFTSIGDTAQAHLPIFPAKWLVKDQFDSASKAPGISVPVLVIHGDEDEVVPYALGKRLSGMFPHAELMTVTRGTHNDLWGRREVVERIVSFAAQ